MIIFIAVMAVIIGFWAAMEVHSAYLEDKMVRMVARWEKEDANSSPKS